MTQFGVNIYLLPIADYCTYGLVIFLSYSYIFYPTTVNVVFSTAISYQYKLHLAIFD